MYTDSTTKNKEKQITMVRQEYVSKIKEYLSKSPDYHLSLNELKADMSAVGATDAEFDQALNELIHPTFAKLMTNAVSPSLEVTKSDQKSKLFASFPFLKKVVAIDVLTHLALFIILFFTFSILIQQAAALQKLKTTKPLPISKPVTTALPTPIQNSPVEENTSNRPIFASSQYIPASRVFSFPPSSITLTTVGKPKKEVFGFLPYWMVQEANNIPIDMLTTVALFGLEVDESGNFVVTYEDGSQDGGWALLQNQQLNTFLEKAHSKHIRVVLTLKSFSNANMDKLTTSDPAQKVFIANAMQLVNAKNLDGINIDFEYVGNPPKEVIDGFSRLMGNLNSELKHQHTTSTLSIDTYLSGAQPGGLINVAEVGHYVDSIVIMGYDVHTPSGSSGPVAPMGGDNNVPDYIQSYLALVPANKLILAVPYYGYDWPINNTGKDSTHIIAYAELAEASKRNVIQWDDTSQTPFYKYVNPETNVVHEVYFENVRSLGIKYDHINKSALQGVGIWALGYDGFNQELQQLLVDKFGQ